MFDTNTTIIKLINHHSLTNLSPMTTNQPAIKRTNPKPPDLCPVVDYLLVRDERLVPLFLIHYVHKNAGRGSTVFLPRKGEKDMSPPFKSLRKQINFASSSRPNKNRPSEAWADFVLVRDERLGHLHINILFVQRTPKYRVTRPRRSNRPPWSGRYIRFLQVSHRSIQYKTQ